MLLQIESISKQFGGLSALSNVSFGLEEGSILGIIGPNGAGKSTMFGCITGSIPLSSGTITFRGKQISGKKPHEIAKEGIARSYQIVQPFGNMTALQNAMVGGFCNNPRYADAEKVAFEALKTVGLEKKKDSVAKTLNLGERKKLEIAKALSTQPKLLLLDEVMAGLTTQEVMEMVGIIRQINASGVTVMIIEHIMEAIMSLSGHIVVLSFGKKIAEGTPKEVSENQEVIDAYFGIEGGEENA